MDKNREYPSTVLEAVNRLLSEIPITTKKQITDSSEGNLINFHFGLGVAIRNEFGLWEKESKLLEDCKKLSANPNLHVDNASGIIINALWERLQKYPPPKIVRADNHYSH